MIIQKFSKQTITLRNLTFLNAYFMVEMKKKTMHQNLYSFEPIKGWIVSKLFSFGRIKSFIIYDFYIHSIDTTNNQIENKAVKLLSFN